jgi:2-polyprenyl-3-methyl-5-hydroxy-6-metoxy-1,4-benzoquinol methylase
MHSVACVLCGVDDTQPYLQLGDLAFGLPGEFHLVSCRRCGLLYLNPRPSADELADYYPASYRPYKKAIEDERWSLMRTMRRRNIRRRRLTAEAHAPRQPGSVLDVGCSTGVFLAEMRDAGWQVTGIELSEQATAYARQRYGLEVIQGSLQDADLPAETFDVITLWDVLEHTYNPLNTLQHAHHLLRDGGVVVATVPNYDSLDRWIFRSTWVGFDVPRHLTVFTSDTLCQLLEKAGLGIMAQRCDFGGFFTFAASVHRWANARLAWPISRQAIKTLVDLPGLRLPFEPFFAIVDRLGWGSELTVIARRTKGA